MLKSLLALALVLLTSTFACRVRVPQITSAPSVQAEDVPVADGFSYPVGTKLRVTKARDGDGWYDAQDFGKNDHLAEDWNGEGGGNTDCNTPVYAAARGRIILADNFLGWGNVIIIRHQLPDGSLVETQYAHLREMYKKSGTVERRTKIGTVGDGDGRFLCHLHFELRTSASRDWGAVGGGYSADRTGWVDPSDFIDRHLAK